MRPMMNFIAVLYLLGSATLLALPSTMESQIEQGLRDRLTTIEVQLENHIEAADIPERERQLNDIRIQVARLEEVVTSSNRILVAIVIGIMVNVAQGVRLELKTRRMERIET